MRLIFVTPRFGAADATPPERLAAELAGRAPGGWRTTVVTTTAAGESAETFREGEIQDKGVRVVRFPAGGSSEGKQERPTDADALTSPGLLQYLGDRSHDYDLVVLFGSSSVCVQAAKLNPGRTVLLPFADEEADASQDAEIFEHPAAFVFGSEAEEILVLKRYQVHRRMRETVAGTLLLPRTADAGAFRRRTGLTGPYLMAAGPLEPGRGIEELLRFFSTFRARHPDAPLELVLVGPAAMPIPERPDIRVVHRDSTRERLDAVGGAFAAVIPERLAAFSTTAAEPFSVGVPILVNASATELAEECRASGGGLYYQNYDEFELILELGLRDPSLFPRMGAAGREFLESRLDWDSVLARYDRAFRSFARPVRGATGQSLPPDSTPPPEAAAPPDPARAADPDDPLPAGEESGQGDSEVRVQARPEPGGSEAPAESGVETSAETAAEPPQSDGSDEAPEMGGARDPRPELETAEDMPPAPEEESSEAGGASEEEEVDSDEDSDLPSFFRSSIGS